MKKTAKALLTLIVGSTILVSCGSKNPKELILKKWQISNYDLDGIDERMAKMKIATDTIKDPEIKARFTEHIKMMETARLELEKSTIEYKADGSLEASIHAMGQIDNFKGSWSISDDGKHLITIRDQRTDTSDIAEISSGKLITVKERGGHKETVTLAPVK